MYFKKYSKLERDQKYNEYIERALDEAEKELENPNTVFLTHEEIFDKLRRNLNR